MDEKSKDVETPKPEPSPLERAATALENLAKSKISQATAGPEKPGPTDTKTRPDFGEPSPEVKAESHQVDKRFSPYTKSVGLAATQARPERTGGGGLLPHRLDSLTDDELKSAHEAFKINKFPQGDIENFSLTRYCFAKQRAHYLGEPSSRNAPWETQFYDAAKDIKVFDPLTKAQGDMVSGQDGRSCRL